MSVCHTGSGYQLHSNEIVSVSEFQVVLQSESGKVMKVALIRSRCEKTME